MKKYLLLPLIFFIGCSHHPMDPDIDIKPPKYVEQMPSKDVETMNNTGSLFNNGDNLFSDKKAMKVNDIVTVLINFKVKASSSGKRQTSEAVNSDLNSINMLAAGANHIAGMFGFNPDLKPLSKVGATRNFQGQGSNTRDDSFTATVTARIIKVLKNGNYFIAGSREVLIDGEKNIIRVVDQVILIQQILLIQNIFQMQK